MTEQSLNTPVSSSPIFPPFQFTKPGSTYTEHIIGKAVFLVNSRYTLLSPVSTKDDNMNLVRSFYLLTILFSLSINRLVEVLMV